MLLVKNAKVYAPEYLGVKDILIAGGRIERIADHLPEYEGCEVIDGTGKIVTPGIIDRHVHVTGGGGEGSFHTQAPQVQLSSLIKGGVTTVLGLLGTDGISRSVENLLAKVKALKEEGISAYAICGAYGYPSTTVTGSVSKDIMFIDEILGVKLAISDHRAPNITTEELIRLASDVRTAGMLSGKPGFICLHMGGDKRALKPVFEALERTSIPPKTFQPTHVGRNANLLEDAFKFAKMGGTIDLTCGESESKFHSVADAVKKAKKEGVPMEKVTMSSDGQGSWSNYDAEGKLVEIGVSDVDTIYRQIVYMVKANVLGTCTLLRTAKVWWDELDADKRTAFRFLHISTDEVFGALQPGDPAFTETTPYSPNSPYSASKCHHPLIPLLATQCTAVIGQRLSGVMLGRTPCHPLADILIMRIRSGIDNAVRRHSCGVYHVGSTACRHRHIGLTFPLHILRQKALCRLILAQTIPPQDFRCADIDRIV